MKIHLCEPRGRGKAANAVGLDCAAAFQAIALGAVGAIKGHLADARAGDAEAVHQIRVAITRLRAAVAFFAPILEDSEWLRLKQEIAWLNGLLGAARDSDVIMDHVRQKKYQAWARPMIDELEERQAGNHHRLARGLRSVRTKRLIVALTRWIRLKRFGRSRSAETLSSYCAGELGRWHARLLRNGRRLEDLGAERRHRLRIRAKRFRYMVEALTETVPLWDRGKCRHLHGPAKRMQGALGDMRDLERLADLADEQGEKRPPGSRHQGEKLLGKAIAAYRDLRRVTLADHRI